MYQGDHTMSRSPQPWRALFLSLACLLLWVLPAQRVHAAVSCTATMTDVDFGSVDLTKVNDLVNLPTGTLNYTCTNDANRATNVRVCFNIGDGNEGFGNFDPRVMKSGSNVLGFQLYQSENSTVWGSNGNAQVPSPFTASFSIPGRFRGDDGRFPGSTTIQGKLLLGQGAVPAGIYQDFFSAAGGHTSISWSSGNRTPNDCSGNTSGNFPFTVRATVLKSCDVTMVTNIQLGDPGGVNFTDTNLMGNNTISVTCSSGTPYYIGLSPLNGNMAGAGNMVAMNLDLVTGNTDAVPYQLRSTAGMAGTIWGNTATSTSVGNGVARTGTGASHSITVYATTPNANFTPDTYQDTVTVTVNY
jgi:spore coat protein U-like protein